MNNSNLRKALEASRFYYAQMYDAMRPAHEKIHLEQKQILIGLYREVAEMESRMQAMEGEFGYKYDPAQSRKSFSYTFKDDAGGDGGDDGNSGEDDGGEGDGNDDGDSGEGGGGHYDPDEPRVPAGNPDGGQWTSGGDGNNDANDSGQLAQAFPLLEGPPVTPPFDEFPQDPTVSPGSGWEWRGSGDPGDRGNWINPSTGEKLNPDLDHGPPQGPHWDYTDPDGNQYRWYPDGTMEPKVVVGGIVA